MYKYIYATNPATKVQDAGEDETNFSSNEEKLGGWSTVKNLALIFLVLGACVRDMLVVDK